MSEFSPNYKNFQKDIERYLTSIGKREKRSDGMIVFRGYDDALRYMFKTYLEEGALEPLTKEFRSWNWEHGYNDFLEELTNTLRRKGDWQNLKLLWENGVLRCRRKLYNDMWKIEKDAPGTIEPKSFNTAKERLREALTDIRELAEAFGSAEEIGEYRKMTEKISKGRKA
jgi:hypothetical protein